MNREPAEKSIGKTYNRLTVLSLNKKGKDTVAECLCSCGTKKNYLLANVKSGKSKSCGCYMLEVLKSGVKPKTHGQSNRKKPTSEYWAWGKLRQRCLNPKNPYYPSYGGRGIFVCERWANSFEAFFEDMGKKPSPIHSIDRINNDDGYYKENCRWATKVEQMGNRRCVIQYDFMGKKLALEAINRLLGFSRGTLLKRIKLGWSFDKAISTPISKKHSESSNMQFSPK